MKLVWHHVKAAVVPFIYLFFMAFISMGIVLIKNDLLILKIALSILNIAFYTLIVAAGAMKEGETALKVRIANDLERVQIIRTGEDRPLKLVEEYKPWKGFLIGFLACVPCIVLLLIHTVLIFGVGMDNTGAGALAGFLYMMFYSLSRLAVSTEPSVFAYYFCLLSVVVVPLITGIPYILGARKIEKQQEKIKQRQREIYGDNI